MIDKIYVIEAHTGCSCCAYENHYRGPYRTHEDAEKRVAAYYAENSNYWPLASQYARRGHYDIRTMTVEEISGGRFILDGLTVVAGLKFINVRDDGTVANVNDERFDALEY
jgi:hypothetical protein